MRKLFFIIPTLLVTACAGHIRPTEALEKWTARQPLDSKELVQQKFANRALSRDEALAASVLLDSLWRNGIRQKYAQAWRSGKLERDSLQMKLGGRIYGEKPADGRSLYISMHGGGSAPAALNDQQWNNQIYLYRPAEGVYIAPRAPWDDWDMWFKPGMDEFLDMLIQTAVAVEGVNPDKVYLLGYSAGGDGVWRMAPRMADRWAAASMMAGHPGNASQVNLRNLPYMIWMGELDAAYDRNRLAAERGRSMDSLQQADPSGYVHETHIVKGKGHWMDRADSVAIPWMAKFYRNPYPQKVVWRQEEVVRPSSYWLTAPTEELKHEATVVAEYKGNEIDIQNCDYSRLTIGLNDAMMDLDQPVTVNYRGKTVFKGKVDRTIGTLYRTLQERGDLKYMFPAIVEVDCEQD